MINVMKVLIICSNVTSLISYKGGIWKGVIDLKKFSFSLVLAFITWLLKVEFTFQELRPPMKMLVPIWKALCAATGIKGSSNTTMEDG